MRLFSQIALGLGCASLSLAHSEALAQRSDAGFPFPNDPKPDRIPTVFIAGDSTAANFGGPYGTATSCNCTDGWGHFLHWSLDSSRIHVNNSARDGYSARRYTRDGYFDQIAEVVRPGDWVIIEFGHNDAGPVYPASADNGRGACPGAGDETCPTVYDNKTEIVQTFPTYIKAASRQFLHRGARVILNAPTGNNPWETGTYTYSPGAFAYYQWLSAAELGGPAAGVYYVPHGLYLAQAIKNLGPNVTDANYPADHGHTAPYLASVVARAFILGVKCGTSTFQEFVVNATARIEGEVLGRCILANETLPI